MSSPHKGEEGGGNVTGSQTSSPSTRHPPFTTVTTGTRHSIGITADGSAYSWGKSNAVGQLGRESSSSANTSPSKHPGQIPIPVRVTRAFCSHGCSVGTGHSALLDQDGQLWMAGCDRWQQLGLGSANGGSSGYTWIDGKLWQDRFVLSNSVHELMKLKSVVYSASLTIRDVALGGDHTLVLASNRRDVYAFGKGGDGQLGLVGKPYVSAPVKSKTLSEDNDGVLLSAVCAIQKCSLTLDAVGSVRNQAGKCRTTMVNEGIRACIARATQAGLIGRDN